jgi:hypothetical protein
MCHSTSMRLGWLGSPRAQTRRRSSKTRAPSIDPEWDGHHHGQPRHSAMHRWTSNCMRGMSFGAPRKAETRFAATGARTEVRTLFFPVLKACQSKSESVARVVLYKLGKPVLWRSHPSTIYRGGCHVRPAPRRGRYPPAPPAVSALSPYCKRHGRLSPPPYPRRTAVSPPSSTLLHRPPTVLAQSAPAPTAPPHLIRCHVSPTVSP